MKSIKPIHRWLSQVRRMIPGAACAAAMLLGGTHCRAQADSAETRTIEGRVSRLTTAPRGEVDGAMLDDGNLLHWPPHLEDQFKQVVVEGERVRASGRTETGPAGDTHFEVQTVTNISSKASATNPDFAAGPPPRHGRPGRGPRDRHPEPSPASDRADETVDGRVVRLTTAPRGEIDGAVLDNGTWLHWPPHLEERFAGLLKKGDSVSATGRTETGPKGDEHFEVRSVKNTQTGVTGDNPDFNNGPRPHHGPRKGPRPIPPHEADRRNSETRDITIRGVVTQMTTAPRGEIDGALLDDGTILHWPPHLQERFTSIVKVGVEVRATGRSESGPRGDAHFEVQSVVNQRTEQSADNPDVRPQPPRHIRDDEDRQRQVRDMQRQIDDLTRQLDRLRRDN